MIHAIGYAARAAHSPLKPFEFERPEPKADEVLVNVRYCGICHSDLHQARNEWKNTLYPCVPGHEIIGVVAGLGSRVKRFHEGDLVGVGCMINSCQACPSCNEGLEQYCENGFLATSNGNQRQPLKELHTYGGFSNAVIAHEKFVLKIPAVIEAAAAGPLLCAGVTAYSPLKRWKVGRGSRIGVIGLGGLGHMAVKLARAMDADVTVITTTEEKANNAIAMGANDVVISTNDVIMRKHSNAFDFILNTIPGPHDVNPYFHLLRRDGIMAIVGCLAPLTKPLDISKLVLDRRGLTTSVIGSIKETQEVLEFCADHNIRPNTKLVPIDQINDAFDDLESGNADFRYVVDMATILDKHEDRSFLGRLATHI